MRFAKWFLLIVLIVGLPHLMGCSGDDAVRSKLWVVSINQNEVLTSDIVNSNGTQDPTDDFVLEDEVTIVIQNDPQGVSNLNLGGPFGFFTIDRYTVEFEAAGHEIDGFTQSLGWTVESGFSVTGPLTVVPFLRKTEPPLISLLGGGQILATAKITFVAREADSDHEVEFSTSMPIHFANWID